MITTVIIIITTIIIMIFCRLRSSVWMHAMQARRGAVSIPQPALVIMPDFSESNLAGIQQGPLFR